MQGLTLVKEYDFRKSYDLSEFTTRLMWPREQIINDEAQFYVNPAKIAPEHTPFKFSGDGLSITAMPTPDDLLQYAIAVTDEGRKIGVESMTDEEYAEHVTPQPFISGILTTRDNGWSQLFGYWEISARLPSAAGAWPALWLLPTFDSWPPGIDILPEIDIMEAVKDVIDGIYHGTVHTNETGKLTRSTDNDIKTDADLVNEFHRYGLRWDADWIIWYFDGVEVKREPTPADMQDEPRHLLMNLAVGGNWAGEPDPADYPASFDIEYVRIYALPEAPTKKTDDSLPGDVVHILADGRAVTRRDIELVAQYLFEINSEAQ